MANKSSNPTVLEEGAGAAGIALAILASPLLRPWYSKWGASKTEVTGRFRQAYEPSLANVVGWRVFTDPINIVMERKMLQGIKIRTETGSA